MYVTQINQVACRLRDWLVANDRLFNLSPSTCHAVYIYTFMSYLFFPFKASSTRSSKVVLGTTRLQIAIACDRVQLLYVYKLLLFHVTARSAVEFAILICQVFYAVCHYKLMVVAIITC